MSFVNDTFTGTDSTNITAHTGETGATWAKGSSAVGGWLITSNRVRCGSATNPYVVDFASGVPSSADYDVSAIFHYFGSVAFTGICGRLQNPSVGIGTFDCYMAAITTGTFQIRKHTGAPNVVSNPGTVLGSYAPGLTVGNDYTVKLQMRGSIISLWVDGTKRIEATDTTISAAGRVGVAAFGQSGATAGVHFDRFFADNPPPIGQHNYLTNTGDWTALPYTVRGASTWDTPSAVTAL